MGLFKYWEARFFLAPFFINCTYKTREYRFWNKFRITWATRIRNVYDISKVRERTTERLFSESQLWLYCYNEYFITQKSERSFLLGVIEGILYRCLHSLSVFPAEILHSCKMHESTTHVNGYSFRLSYESLQRKPVFIRKKENTL